MFNNELEGTFKIFSTSHLFAVLVVLSIVGIVYYFKETLKQKEVF